MALPNGSGGYQLGDGNLNEASFRVIPAPATATATATLTAAQVLSNILLGSPGTSAASYTLPTVADLEAALPSATKAGVSFDLSVVNVDGSSSGVITLVAGTGWTLVGLMTVVATAGTAQLFRARKTGDGTWSLYRVA
jgi:hypothetical protein